MLSLAASGPSRRSYGWSWSASPDQYDPGQTVHLTGYIVDSYEYDGDGIYNAQISGTDGSFGSVSGYAYLVLIDFSDYYTPSSPGTITYYLDFEDCEYLNGCVIDGGDLEVPSADPRPASARIASWTDTTRDCPYCAGSNWEVYMIYQLVDQWGDDFHGSIFMHESFTDEATNCPVDFTSGDVQANSSGQWSDTLWFCHLRCCDNPPYACETYKTQAWENYFGAMATNHILWYCFDYDFYGPY
jgi:hypothetical protein